MYLSLHTHSVKSIGDSILTIDDYIEKAKSLNLPAISITNHGSIIDIYETYIKAKKNNLKPILGCEFYFTEDINIKDRTKIYHLVLIAINKKGYDNLILLHNKSQLEGFFYKPRIDFKMLEEHSEGLICLSACLGGIIPRTILEHFKEEEDKYEDILNYINKFKQIFNDRFYLELQPGNFEEQIKLNECLIYLSKETNTKTIITNDVHYLNKEDYVTHNVHVCSNRKKTDATTLIYPDTCYYMMSEDEIIQNCKHSVNKEVLISSLNNISYIIDEVEEYDIINKDINMPKPMFLKGYSECEYLEKLCYEKLDEISHLIEDPSIYISRIQEELYVLDELGFCGYFLVIYDILQYAKKNKIPYGPGRGSVAGSLIAYLIGITKVDAIKYELLFSRFLSKDRKGSIPDIDLDISSKNRHLIFQYVIDTYGVENCALVSTFIYRKTKSAIKDAGRAYGIDKDVFEYAASLVPATYYIDNEDGDNEKITDLSIEDTCKINSEFKEICDKNKEWFEAAKKLTGIPKATSIHAAGTIISPHSLYDKIPLIKNTKGLNATSLNLSDAEICKYVKMDFLGCSNLDIIKDTLLQINKENIDFIPETYDDINVWNLIGSKYTVGLFQIGTPTYRQRMSRLKPKSIEELAACLALVRGPCISNKLDQKYMDILAKKQSIESIHYLYDNIMLETNGIMLYQEQLMKLCVAIGFSIEESYVILKASAKKKFSVLEEYEKEFYLLAKEKNIDTATSEILFKMIIDSGLYSFNKSHAISYSIFVYQTAYLKTYYPKEYMLSCLKHAYESKSNIDVIVKECRRLGFKFVPPNINNPSWDFKLLNNNECEIGLCAYKSFSYDAYLNLKTLLPINNIDDFINKSKKINKTGLTSLIFAGAFSNICLDRVELYKKYCESNKKDYNKEFSPQGNPSLKLGLKNSYIEYEEAFLTQPLLSNNNNFEYIDYENIKDNHIFNIDSKIIKISKTKTKKGDEMAFLELETGNGNIDIVVFPDKFSSFKKLLKKNSFRTITARKKNNSFIFISCVENIKK